MPKVYSYLRFSSPEQSKGDSKRRQSQAVKEYAEAHNLEIDHTLEPDEGVSAFDGSNILKGHLGGFLALLEDGQIEKGSVLLVESLDRISRQQILGSLEVFTKIISKGVKIVTLADNREYDSDSISENPFELIASLLILQRANEESKMKSKRISAAWAEKRRNINSKKLSAICPEWLSLDRDEDEFRAVPERASLVKRIFEESRNGVGQGSIAKKLNGEGVETWGRGKRKGRSWHTSTINKILTNKAVLGHYQPHRMEDGKRVPVGSVVEAYFPRIIEDDLFFEVQELRRMRRPPSDRGQDRVRAANRREGISNLFTGFVKCGYCGSSMRYVSKGSNPTKAGKYLVCSKAVEGKGCRYVTTRYEVFEENFIRSIRTSDLSDFLDRAKENEGQSKLESERLGLEGRIADLDEQIERLTNAIAMGGEGSPKAIVEKIQTLEADKETAKTRLMLVRGQSAESAGINDRGRDLRSVLDSVSESLDKLQGEELFDFRSKLRDSVLRIIKTVTIFPRNREIHFMQLETLGSFSAKNPDAFALALALQQEDRPWPKPVRDRPMIFSVETRSELSPLYVCAGGRSTRIHSTSELIRNKVLKLA